MLIFQHIEYGAYSVAARSPLHLGKREREVVEALYRLGGVASVSEVRAALAEPPTYSAVRAVLNLLVDKRVLTSRPDGRRLLYRPAPSRSKERVRLSVLRNLVQTFFGSAPVDAVAALLDGSAGDLSPDDLRRVREMIERAERAQPPTEG